MKLELKHLVGYLPYGLKCKLLNYRSDYVGEKYGTCNGYYIFNNEPYFTFKDRSTAGKTVDIIKPILRPLSDLTEEIEVNGEKFVPINKIDIQFGMFYYFSAGVNGLLAKRRNTNMYSYVSEYEMILQKLFEWHFDIYNLIGQGLAIDINTIK